MRRFAFLTSLLILLISVRVGATASTGAARAEREDGVLLAQAHGEGHATPAAGTPHDEHGHATPAETSHPAHGETPTEPGHHDAAAGESHGAAHAEHSPTDEAIHAAENASIVDLILKNFFGYHKPAEGEKDHNSETAKLIAAFQMPIISAVVIIVLAFGAIAGTRKREMIPGPFQNFVEMIVGGLDDFVQGILGLHGRHFVPFIGTLFLYIWVSNLIGIVPGFKSPTSSFNTTVALAICVFLYVQWTGIRRNGIGGYLYHLAGEPKDGLGWGLVILLFPLHLVGELAKPMSLSLRLFGNIFGEETLIAVFVGLGVVSLAALHSPVGLPLHVPFLFLALLTSLIQAMVFSLLATIYFALMLPHHEHAEEHH